MTGFNNQSRAAGPVDPSPSNLERVFQANVLKTQNISSGLAYLEFDTTDSEFFDPYGGLSPQGNQWFPPSGDPGYLYEVHTVLSYMPNQVSANLLSHIPNFNLAIQLPQESGSAFYYYHYGFIDSSAQIILDSLNFGNDFGPDANFMSWKMVINRRIGSA